MFSIFKRKSNALTFPYYLLKTDMHSHLIPAVDDGSQNEDESLFLIRGMMELGFEKLITTPHVMQDMYPNNRQSIGMGYDEIIRYIPEEEKEKINTSTLSFGAEYFLDDHVLDLMEKNVPLLTIKDKLVLVEISFASPPMGLKEMLFDLQMKGYQPILAHPERYTFYHRTPSVYKELKETGVLFQSNLLSFSGYYGGSVKDAAEYLANGGMLELLGTDLHHDRHLSQLRELPFTQALQNAVSHGLMNASL
jgi:tyrosine-protein phosphatase YwqE